MPDKSRVLFHLNQCGYGGTEKAILTFCENLDRSRFEPFVYIHQQRPDIKQKIRRLARHLSQRLANRYSAKYELPYVRLERFRTLLGEDHVYVGDVEHFSRAVTASNPAIVHFNRGNWSPLFDQFIDVVPAKTPCVETNIFGKPANERYDSRLTTSYFVSEWLRNKATWCAKGRVLYNPIKYPQSNDNLRDELDIPSDAVVLGRICRPDMIDNQFVADVWGGLQRDNIYLVILGCSQSFIAAAKMHENVRTIAPTTSEETLSRFYNTIDILLHYRIDGETFGMNIAEAMIHEKPVVSHFSTIDNAQAELLLAGGDDDAGYVCKWNDIDEYVGYVRRLIDDRNLRDRLGRNAKQRATRLFGENTVTRYLEAEYAALLETRR